MKYSSTLLLIAMSATLSACGGGGSGSGGAVTTPPPPASNSPPTVSAVQSQTIQQDAIGDPITFEVGDAQSGPSAVSLAAESSNSELIADAGISLAGDGASRTITLTPAAGIAGTTTLTLVASDQEGATTRQSFDVTVTSEQRSFREMVGTAFDQQEEGDGESIAGYSWVDTAEDDDAAFDNLLAE